MTDRALVARYPFLPGADALLGDYHPSLQELVEDGSLERARALAREEVTHALAWRGAEPPRTLEAFDAAEPEVRVLSFLYSRMLVAASPSAAALGRRWGEGVARSAGALLARPGVGVEELVEVFRTLGLAARPGPTGTRRIVLSLPSYVQLASGLREERFRLARRDPHHGEVDVEVGVAVELLVQGIREYLLDEVALLPLAPELKESVRQREGELLGRMAALAPSFGPGGFGSVLRPELFPPCMKEMRSRLAQGGNVSHHGRFALASFLHKVGADVDTIVDSYRGAANFKEGITRYQVTQITHHDGGMGYTPPDCATLIANGLCFREQDPARPSLCADPTRLRNPLNYYRLRLRSSGPPAARTATAPVTSAASSPAGDPSAPATSSAPASTPSPAPPPQRPAADHRSA